MNENGFHPADMPEQPQYTEPPRNGGYAPYGRPPQPPQYNGYAQPPQYGAPAPYGAAPAYGEYAPSPKKKSNLKTIIIIASAALVAVIALVLVLTLGGGAEKNAEKFIEAFCEGDMKTAFNMMAFDVKDAIMSEYDDFVDEETVFELLSYAFGEDIDSWDDYYNYYGREMKEELEYDFGKYKVSVRAVGSEKIDIRDEYDADDIEDITYGQLSIGDIKECVLVEVEATVDGEYDRESDTTEVYMVKVGSSWKVLECEDFTDVIY